MRHAVDIEPALTPPDHLPGGRLRVVVAVAEPFVAAGICAVLEEGGLGVTSVASDEHAIAAALATEPDALLLDADLDGDVVDATRRAAAALPRTATVLLTAAVDRRAVVAGLQAGAAGYLLKSVGAAGLVDAVRTAVRGEAVVSRPLLRALLDALSVDGVRHRDLADGRVVALTPREWEVAELLDRGESTAAMAAELGLSPVTVRRHLSGLMRKLDVTARGDARLLLRVPDGRPPRR
jgi:DNA-binding NarL/FixJ family response regulator